MENLKPSAFVSFILPLSLLSRGETDCRKRGVTIKIAGKERVISEHERKGKEERKEGSLYQVEIFSHPHGIV